MFGMISTISANLMEKFCLLWWKFGWLQNDGRVFKIRRLKKFLIRVLFSGEANEVKLEKISTFGLDFGAINFS